MRFSRLMVVLAALTGSSNARFFRPRSWRPYSHRLSDHPVPIHLMSPETTSPTTASHLSAPYPPGFLEKRSNSAWNGQILPGSIPNGTAFTPFYVPVGSTSVDDVSSSIIYSASPWKMVSGPAYIENTLHTTNASGASMSTVFFGTGIEWFGCTSPGHGLYDVYLDEKKITTVDGSSITAATQQRLWGISSLPNGQHMLRIVNTGKTKSTPQGAVMDLDAFVVDSGTANPTNVQTSKVSNVRIAGLTSQWTLVQRGNTGVAAMQLSIVSDTHALMMDKVEHNLIDVNGHPAWGALYDLTTDEVRPLNVLSNSFCAGGSFLSNGTVINVGGNPVVTDKTGAADFGDVNGLQAVRLFTPCGDGSCDIFEDPQHIRMASPRWYTTVTRLDDGSAMIIGGSKKGGWINNATVNNPTVEFFPPKNVNGYNGLPVPVAFLDDTLNSNLFPIAFTLPDGRVFLAANSEATIYNWRTNTEERLPQIPNGVRITYPMTGTAVMLPLTPTNNYTATIVLCGGSTLNDTTPGYELSSQAPASNQCSRITLTDAGIAAGWEVEHMPAARIMPDAVLLPDGRVLIVNGGETGIAGYGNTQNQIGQSNAANPVFQPVLYDPSAPLGQRFSSAGMPISQIARLYHSVATLTPNGDIMIAGSNPNLDRSNVEFQTEYRVEWLSPPYMNATRPTYSGLPTIWEYGETIQLDVQLPRRTKNVTVSLIDLGFVTHAVHMNSRLVQLHYSASPVSSNATSSTLTITAPSSGLIYPPGYGWLYILADGVPSLGKRVMIGDGSNPPEDVSAITNLLSQTSGPTIMNESNAGER